MLLMLVTDLARACPDARTETDLHARGLRWLIGAVEAGIDFIQVRERSLTTRRLGAFVGELVSAASGSSTRIVINDRADVAVATGADGVHLRDDGWASSRVRALRSRPWIVGQSIHGDTVTSGLDYALFGAVFDSGPKLGVGLEMLRTVANASDTPVLAIGGITPTNAAACLAAGARGVAAISMFLPPGTASGALGPREATARLRSPDTVIAGHR